MALNSTTTQAERRKKAQVSGHVNKTNTPALLPHQQQQRICTQKFRLLDAYKLAAEEYSKALAELNRNIGTSSRSEYTEMYRKVESLRGNTVILREELEWHVHKHGC
jgi:hypothetical protein